MNLKTSTTFLQVASVFCVLVLERALIGSSITRLPARLTPVSYYPRIPKVTREALGEIVAPEPTSKTASVVDWAERTYGSPELHTLQLFQSGKPAAQALVVFGSNQSGPVDFNMHLFVSLPRSKSVGDYSWYQLSMARKLPIRRVESVRIDRASGDLLISGFRVRVTMPVVIRWSLRAELRIVKRWTP